MNTYSPEPTMRCTSPGTFVRNCVSDPVHAPLAVRYDRRSL